MNIKKFKHKPNIMNNVLASFRLSNIFCIDHKSYSLLSMYQITKANICYLRPYPIEYLLALHTTTCKTYN